MKGSFDGQTRRVACGTAAMQALEFNKSDLATVWTNPDTGNSKVFPTRTTNLEVRFCRSLHRR